MLSRSLLLVEYLLISVTGFCLLFFGIIDKSLKIEVLTITFIVSLIPISFRIFTKKWTLKDLGFRFDNFKSSIPPYLLVTLSGVAGLLFFGFFYKTYKITVDQNTLIFYSFWGAIAQEILYRGYLMKLGEKTFGKGWFAIIMNIIVFVGMHAFYPGFLQKLLILLPAGFIFTLLYKYYPNIILVCISHIILNATAVMLGVFN
jgi:membrane protease YdiL (CAAX protease family)